MGKSEGDLARVDGRVVRAQSSGLAKRAGERSQMRAASSDEILDVISRYRRPETP